MIQLGALRYGILFYCSLALFEGFLLLALGDIFFLVLEIFFIPQSAIIVVLSLLGVVSFTLSGFFMLLCASHFWELYKPPKISIDEDIFSLGISRPMSQEEEDAYYLREGIQRNFLAGTNLGEVALKYYAACDLLRELEIIDGNISVWSQEDSTNV